MNGRTESGKPRGDEFALLYRKQFAGSRIWHTMSRLNSPYGEDRMTFMNINLWSVLAAAIATMVAGFLWYSPVLFARPWMVAMGYDPEDKAKIKEMQKSAGKS